MEKFILNKNLFFVEEKNGYVVIEQKSASLDTWVYRDGKVFKHGKGASMNDDCIIATINFKLDDDIPYALTSDYEAGKTLYDEGFLIKLWGLAKMGYSYERAMKELSKPKLIKSIEFETKVISEELIGMCGDNEIWDGIEEFVCGYDKHHSAGYLLIKNIKYLIDNYEKY